MPSLLRSLSLLAASSLLQSCAAQQKVLNDESQSCPDAPYTVHLVSQDPMVVYLENFLLPKEAQHLQAVSKGQFTASEIADEGGAQKNATSRTSRSTPLKTDPVVRCIKQRAMSFQGFDIQPSQLEPLQLVRYSIGERYHTHTDWFEAESQATKEVGGNRLSSFFVYVAADEITGGGTNFPLLTAPRDERWCQFIDCYEPWESGITFRPIPGNGIFWMNLDKDGIGSRATLHAGLPPTSGTKLGMNIWTREGPLERQYRDDALEEQSDE